MFTHSSISRVPSVCCRLRKSTALLLVLMFYAGLAFSQSFPVRIAVAVIPPYTTKISDYTSQPNKIMVTVQNTSPTGQTLQVYLTGVINSEGGIRVYTEPGFKPAQPLTLLPGASVLLNLSNIGDIFDGNHLVYKGISEREMIYGNGLPEDDYTICLQAFDFNTGEPLSDEDPAGCSAPFSITDLEPPVILLPLCEEVIAPVFPQNLLISWTMPAGAPLAVQYRLMMIEVLPADHNIHDAINSATHPVFYETTVFGNALVFGAAMPAMVTGKVYAFNITAVDPSGKASFRNGGTSEACSFTYGSDVLLPDSTMVGTEVIGSDFEEEFEQIAATMISGRLLCKYADNPDGPYESNPQNTTVFYPGSLIITPSSPGNGSFNYGQIAGIGAIIQGNANNNGTGFGFYIPGGGITQGNGATEAMNAYGEPLIQQMRAKKYNFENTETQQFTKPLPHTTVKLIARVALMGKFSQFGVTYPLGYKEDASIYEALNLNGKMENAAKCANVVLDVTETDENGDYTFNFSSGFFTGPVIATDLEAYYEQEEYETPIDELGWIVFPGSNNNSFEHLQNPGQMGGVQQGQTQPGGTMVGGQQQVMSGQITSTESKGYMCLTIEVENQKFCSPDIEIFAMPGDVVSLPVQMARLKTYDLTVNVKSNNQKNQLNNANAPLAGVAVSILRDNDDVEKELPLILSYEGQRLNTKTFNSNGVFKDVGLGKTNVSGTIIFRNLVRHAYIEPQYLIDLSTRDFDKVETSYDNTLYNYKNIFSAIITNTNTNALGNDGKRSTFNHEYPVHQVEIMDFMMEPLQPEIKGRVMALTNIENTGMPDVRVELLNQSAYSKFTNFQAFINGCYGNRESQDHTNDAGFFRFEGLSVNDNNPDNNVLGPYRRVYIKYPAYEAVIIPPFMEFPYNLSYGQLKDVKDVNLVPEKLISGFVQDEDGAPVVSYVKSAYSPFYKTIRKVKMSGQIVTAYETFSVPTVYDQVTLTVNPLSSQYFSLDTSFIIHSGEVNVVVYKKLHRSKIKVVNSQGLPIAGALVEIGPNKATTNANGEVRLKFAAAADQFIIKITPTGAYAPLQEPISIPVSSSWRSYSYVLKNARSIRGTIKEAVSKQAVENALIFAELLQTDGLPLYIEATSDAQGAYRLNGIPADQVILRVHVVKEGKDPSWAGTTANIRLSAPNPGGMPPVFDFTITRLDGWDMTDIWGFPLVVENFQPVNVPHGQTPEATLSGYLVRPPALTGFSLLQQDLRIHFGRTRVRKATNSKPEPVSSSIKLDVLEIPVTLAGTYSGSLHSYADLAGGIRTNLPGGVTEKINLILNHRELFGESAGIEGQVKLALNSFVLGNNFSGELYIGDDTLSSKTIVFTAASLPAYGNRHFVFSINNRQQPIPVSNYRVFNFNADADLGLSVQEGSAIRLRTILHTSIPGCATCPPLDLKVRAGDLVINGPDISFVEAPDEKLNFSLEKWKVYSQKSWYFDKNEESIVLPEVLIVTGLGVDARVKNMKIRPASLSEGVIDFTGGLSLGGIANIRLSGNLKPVFNYDHGIGHYRISLVGQSSEAAGYVDNLPNTAPSRLEFASIGMLSNDENVLTIGKTFRFYNILDMYVDQIMTGNGFFKLNGQPDLGIPGFIPQSAVVAYSLENNKIKATVEPLKGVVECSGNLDFILDPASVSQTVTPGKFTIYGDVKVMPAPGANGNPFYLRGFLTKTNSKCGFDIIQVDNQRKYVGNLPQEMIVGANKMMVISGKAEVNGNQWGLLSYRAKSSSVNGLNPAGKPDNIFDFVVNGAIDINNSDLQVNNIDTPLGGLSMVYNFSDGSMVGSLTMKNLPLGYAYLTEGMAAIRFDNNGFYIAINLNSFTLGPMGEFKGGFIAGATKKVQPADIAGILQFRTSLPPFTTSGLTGLYVIGEKVIIDTGFDLVFATVTAQGGLGMYVTTNFNSNPEFSIGGYGYVYLSGSQGFDAGLLSCEAGACVTGYFGVKGGYYNNTFNIDNCATVAFKPYLDGSCADVLSTLGLGSILDLVHQGVSIKNDFGCNGTSFYFNLTPFATCPGSGNGTDNADCN